jgi:hypothetical protein
MEEQVGGKRFGDNEQRLLQDRKETNYDKNRLYQ